MVGSANLMSPSLKKPLAVLLLVLLFGCAIQSDMFYVYEVYSDYPDPIRILDCEGLGEAQPSGIVEPNDDEVPNTTMVFPRLGAMPTDFVIRWVNMRTDEEFRQEMKFPTIPASSQGVIECRLGKDNVWLWSFRQED